MRSLEDRDAVADVGAGGNAESADLSGGRVQALPLALAPALGATAVGGQVLEVLAADFDRSGLFKLLDPTSFLADPQEGTEAAKINFTRWTAVGAQAAEAASRPAQRSVTTRSTTTATARPTARTPRARTCAAGRA